MCSIIGLQKDVILKPSKWYRALCAHNPNKKGINKRIVPRTCILKKGRRKKERISFPKPKIKKRK